MNIDLEWLNEMFVFFHTRIHNHTQIRVLNRNQMRMKIEQCRWLNLIVWLNRMCIRNLIFISRSLFIALNKNVKWIHLFLSVLGGSLYHSIREKKSYVCLLCYVYLGSSFESHLLDCVDILNIFVLSCLFLLFRCCCCRLSQLFPFWNLFLFCV